jgi:ethanolaminephosphotransferase
VYTSPRDTVLEALFLHRFWAFLTRACCPLWIAPNLLTAVGLAHAFVAYALLLAYSPALEGSAPAWVYVTCAAMLFVYQTMDGMDGKQARRTGGGTPLGEVTDHGADAIAACVYGAFICDAFGVGWGGGGVGGEGGGRWAALALITYSRVTFLVDSVTATYTAGGVTCRRPAFSLVLFSPPLRLCFLPRPHSRERRP